MLRARLRFKTLNLAAGDARASERFPELPRSSERERERAASSPGTFPRARTVPRRKRTSSSSSTHGREIKPFLRRIPLPPPSLLTRRSVRACHSACKVNRRCVSAAVRRTLARLIVSSPSFSTLSLARARAPHLLTTCPKYRNFERTECRLPGDARRDRKAFNSSRLRARARARVNRCGAQKSKQQRTTSSRLFVPSGETFRDTRHVIHVDGS